MPQRERTAGRPKCCPASACAWNHGPAPAFHRPEWNRPKRGAAMRARALRLLLTLLVAAAGVPFLPSASGVPQASAAGTIRWGYYITYAPDSLVSLKTNIDNLTHVSPYYYSLKADGTIDTKYEQPDTTAFMRAHGVKVLPMLNTAAQNDAF